MPLYDYHCQTCGKTFELLRRRQDVDRNPQCPDCHSNQVERLLSTFNSVNSVACRPSGASRFR